MPKECKYATRFQLSHTVLCHFICASFFRKFLSFNARNSIDPMIGNKWNHTEWADIRFSYALAYLLIPITTKRGYNTECARTRVHIDRGFHSIIIRWKWYECSIKLQHKWCDGHQCNLWSHLPIVHAVGVQGELFYVSS